MIIDPNDLTPPDSGTWRVVNVVAPESTVVNVLPPAPVVYQQVYHHLRESAQPDPAIWIT